MNIAERLKSIRAEHESYVTQFAKINNGVNFAFYSNLYYRMMGF